MRIVDLGGRRSAKIEELVRARSVRPILPEKRLRRRDIQGEWAPLRDDAMPALESIR